MATAKVCSTLVPAGGGASSALPIASADRVEEATAAAREALGVEQEASACLLKADAALTPQRMREHLIAHGQNITELDLQGKLLDWSERQQVQLINQIREHCPKLQVLNVSYNGLIPGVAAIFYKLPSSLVHLNLEGNAIGVCGVRALAECMPRLPALKVLKLGRNGLNDDSCKVLAQALCTHSSLVHLDLNTNFFGMEGARDLEKGLRAQHSLKELNLSGNLFTMEATVLLMTAIQTLTQLKRLEFDGSPWSWESIDALAPLKHLEHLSLRGAYIDQWGAEVLAFVLQELPALTFLDLWDNRLGPTGSKSLVEGLSKRSGLTHLNLGCNRIRAAGMRVLLGPLSAMKHLVSLNLSRNQLGDQGAAILASALSHLR